MHDKEDLFSHLHVNVSDEGFDLYDGLSRYFDDIVEVDGVKKRMEVTLVDLPPLLQIQLQVSDTVLVSTTCSRSPIREYNSIGTRNKRTSHKRM